MVLVAGQVPEWAVPVAGAEPPWWYPGRYGIGRAHAVPAAGERRPAAGPEPVRRRTVADEPNPLPDNIVRTKAFDGPVLAGRPDRRQKPQIKNLLQALLGTGAHEITLAQAATALGVATTSVNGALMQTKRVLDVEGYEVLRVGGGVVRLDVAALKEQFGVTE